MRIPYNATWYDYKMLCVARLMKHDMQLIVDDKGIHVFEEGLFVHIATYKKMKWEKFYNEILPRLVKGE